MHFHIYHYNRNKVFPTLSYIFDATRQPEKQNNTIYKESNNHGYFFNIQFSWKFDENRSTTCASVGLSIAFSTGIGDPMTTLIGLLCGNIPNL